MPILVSPPSMSVEAVTSAQTRVITAPTVRHATRISSVTACLEVWVASQATCSSKTRVDPAP